MNQAAFRFRETTDYFRENFLVSDCNMEAFSWVDKWPDWPSHCLLIYGQAGCGKTHLSHIWREKAGADFIALSDIPQQSAGNYIIEDIENLSPDYEEKLFHLYNQTKEEGNFLLLTAKNPANRLGLGLPDLISRLNSVPNIAVGQPDDNLLAAVITKHFTDRQLRVKQDVIAYLISRIERSFTAAKDIVDKIDKYAMENRREITIPMVREFM